MTSKLRTRTEEFARTTRTAEAILHFSKKNRAKEQSQPFDPEFYSCEFVGFLDEEETRVGCMLHPLGRGNQGIDWRGLSFHGAMACRGFFCRSYRELSTAEKKVILGTITDWFLFGLVISDADFTHSFFRLAEERLGRHIDPAELAAPPASALVNEFFHWKIDWPYRNSSSELKSSEIPEALGTKQNVGGQESEQSTLAPLDKIFISLGSKFRSHSERKSAEDKISQLFSRLSKVL